MTDLKSVGIHGSELAGYSSVVGQPIMLKNEAGNYIGQLALIGFQGEYKEAVAAISEALDAPNRHAYKVGLAVGRVRGLQEAAQIVGRYDEESDCPSCCDVTAINEEITALIPKEPT